MPFSKYSPAGLHLYSKTGGPVIDKQGKKHEPSVVVWNETDEKIYLDLGYTTTYVAREFPKAVEHIERDGASHVVTVATSAKHEAELKKASEQK